MSNTSINTSKKAQKLDELINEQEALLGSLRRELDGLDADGIISENERLTQSLIESEKKSERLKNENEKLSKQLEAAKASLFARMANEKLAVFTRTQRKLEETYYTDNLLIENRLEAYRKSCIENLNLLQKRIESFSQEGYDDLLCKIKALDYEITQRHEEIAARLEAERSAVIDENNKAGAALRNEGLTETEKKTALKQKNLEAFIGLNVLSKAGILLFIIGIIALGRFAYVMLPDAFKGIMIYALGGLLIGAGELFHKKEKSVFSTALISGGVAVLYAATATSYFALELFSVKIAFVLCIVITAITIALSMQIKNQVVCAFGAVGGYMPLIATFMIGSGYAAADKTFLPVSAVYFCLLSVVIFLMTYNKKWYAAQYIGYGFQIIAIGGVAKCAWVLRDSAGYGYALPLAAAFAIASFIIYLMMPSNKIIRGKEITASDVVLMGLNTVSGAISVGITISNCFAQRADGNRAAGLVFLAFAVIYAFLSKAASKNKTSTTSAASAVRWVLYGALFALSLLVVPFVFGWQFAGIAWAAEGAVIASVANNKNNTPLEISGFVCVFLSIPTFAIVCTLKDINNTFTPIVIVTLTVFIVSMWIYTILALSNKERAHILHTVLEIAMSALSVAYLIYVYNYALHLPFVNYFCKFTDTMVYALILALVSLVIKRGILRNQATDITAFIYRVAMFICVFAVADIFCQYNTITLYFGKETEVKWLAMLNIVLMIITNILTIVLLSASTAELINRYEMPAWIYTAVISVSSLALITAVIMRQFDIKFSNVIISAVYIAAACVLLFIGFRKRFTVVRTGGLALILTALAKLCFVDTHALNTGWKIGAYFAFGAILIAISFFYQRFSKKLESEAMEAVDTK